MELDLGGLRVRSWRREDLSSLLHHANNPKIAANLRDQFPHPYTRRDGIEFLRFVRQLELETSFAIEYQGLAVGGVGFRIGDDIARISAEIGYWLGEEFWGLGLVTRAVLGISDWAFDNYRIARVFAMVFSYNAPSIRVLQKAGFTWEATLRKSAIKHGQILDQELYAKVR